MSCIEYSSQLFHFCVRTPLLLTSSISLYVRNNISSRANQPTPIMSHSILFLMLFWKGAASRPRLPLPAQLTATYTQQVLNVPGQPTQVNMTSYIDVKAGSVRLDPSVAPLPQCKIHISEWFFLDSGYYIESGICRQVPGYSSRKVSMKPILR